jgi:hypothetical protein
VIPAEAAWYRFIGTRPLVSVLGLQPVTARARDCGAGYRPASSARSREKRGRRGETM